MDKIFNAVSIITGLAGGLIASLFGAWNTLLWALIIIMVLDYVSGLIKAVYTGTMSSKIGFRGLLKKVTILVIAVSYTHLRAHET